MEIFQVDDVGVLGTDGAGEDPNSVGEAQLERAGAGDLGGEGDDDLVWTNGANQGIAGQFAGFDPVLLTSLELIDGKGNGANGSKNGEDGKKDGKNGFDGNAPKLVVLQFYFLGAFESEKLMEGEKITMIFGAGIDGDVVGNDVVGDTRHRFLANRAGDGGIVRGGILGSNRIEILGSNWWNKIGNEGGNEVTTAVETLVD
ncbi:MAG: hypothetical protein Q8Q26_05275 [Pseudorhodobacter sp.]|nr:hypothetical protein [Pseudorhodobacter sp.]